MEPKVIIIAPQKPNNEKASQKHKKRVGAYCRVSTNNDEQLNSFYNQIAYYVSYIAQQEEWEFADFYADEGLSGTKAWIRDEFNRMLEDCRNGKIDLILVKSVSRFARNVVDCLAYVRELREYNVDVYFENENLHSIDFSSEFLLSIHAMHAQEQSISISNNQRWATKKRMESGVWLPTFVGYGYKIEDDEIVKDQATAAVIERIKQLYLNGYSAQKIVKHLKQKHISGIRNTEEWNDSEIIRILTDPFYRGDLIAQKTYTTDSFPFERRWNKGEKEKYVYKSDHEPYINSEEGKLIDEILSRRKSNSFAMNQSQEKDCFSKKIICALCGNIMKRVILGKDKVIGYSCKLHIRNHEACQNKTVLKTTIQAAFIRMINQLKSHNSILEKYLQDLIRLDEYFCERAKTEQMLQELEKIKKQIHKTVMEYNQGLCEFAFYVQEIRRLRSQEQEINHAMVQEQIETRYKEKIRLTKELQKILESRNYMIDFEDELFSIIVDKVKISNQTMVAFLLKNGMELTECVEV